MLVLKTFSYWNKLTQTNTTVFKQIAKMVKHGSLILSADSTEVAQESTAVGHHFGEADFLKYNDGTRDVSNYWNLILIKNETIRASFNNAG